MANMTINDRNQIERAAIGGSDGARIGTAGRRFLVTYVAVASALLGALLVAAVQVFDGWPHLAVIGALAVLVLGLAAWVYPDRKHV